ncbi:MAG: PIG-L family deacetylase, partial [Planctomycetota bacterium]|nr:PIG-L family deacetylase [Planctomycetota bacterium]
MTENDQFEVLAFGPHPDDVEMCCGGLLISMAERGYRIAVADLTEGELGSNGTVEGRRLEAKAAAEVMGLSHRENLKLPDGWLSPWSGEGLAPDQRPA